MAVSVKALKVENQVTPLGIDDPSPRFSWTMNDPRRGARQTAYQIQVSCRGKVTWDTGKVASGTSILIPYEGPALKARTRYQWRVRIWDHERTAAGWSARTWFETGLMAPARWKAQWAQPSGRKAAFLQPACYLRNEFVLDKDIASARLYATAQGVYEFHLNGARVGDSYFAPGWTKYERRYQYQTYDITGLLKKGRNAVGAMLGDGWFCGTIGGAWDGGERRYGSVPSIRAEIDVTLVDGTTVRVYTDTSWRWTTGPILMSDIYMGETYDARKELGNWATAGYRAGRWKPTRVVNVHGPKLIAQAGPPVRAVKELRPKKITQPAPGVWILDMGQNMVGWERLRVKGRRGATVTVRHAERLNPDGTLYTENLRRAKATSSYTLKGGAEEVFEPHFTFYGFQYVELTGFPGKPSLDTITGVVLHSDMPQTGSFSCSDKLLNQLQHNIEWGQRGNYLDVPTDCPQRDERLGWTGDAQVFVRTAAHNFDISRFYNKWLYDLNDSQSKQGRYPNVAPELPSPDGTIPENGGVSAWSDAGVICPWTIYRCYGDTRLLERHYDGMSKWMAFQRKDSTGLIRARACFADWLHIKDYTPEDVISTAFFAYTSRLMAEMAEVLGKKADARRYRTQFDDVKAAFNREFVTPNGRLVPESQTTLVLALHYDLLPTKARTRAIDTLVKSVEKRKDHLSCGFVGSPYINFVLSDNDRLDVAYRLLHQTSWPSWLYAVTQGATTIWERWDGWTHDRGFQSPSMNSFNHYAYGAIGEWLYRRVAGIDTDASRVAFKHVVIAPNPGGNLKHAKARYESVHGTIVSGWKLSGKTLTVDVTIPANTTATVSLPASSVARVRESSKALATAPGVRSARARDGRVVCDVGAGSYRFVVR